MKVIYLDVDGVLAQWTTGVFEMLGVPATWQDVTRWNGCNDIVSDYMDMPVKEAERLIWNSINDAGYRFWESLKWFEDGERLYELCCNLAPTILVTSPGSHHSSSAGKHAWVYKHEEKMKRLGGNVQHNVSGTYGLKPVRRRFAICPAKAMLAHPEAVLIDDKEKNCDRFEAAGGHAILWPRPWNREQGTPEVALELLRVMFA